MNPNMCQFFAIRGIRGLCGVGGGGGGGCVQNFSCIRDSIYMQHDHIHQKLNFDFLTPSSGSGGGGGSAVKIFATMLMRS